MYATQSREQNGDFQHVLKEAVLGVPVSGRLSPCEGAACSKGARKGVHLPNSSNHKTHIAGAVGLVGLGNLQELAACKHDKELLEKST